MLRSRVWIYLPALVAATCVSSANGQFPGVPSTPDNIAGFEGLRRGLSDVFRAASQSGSSGAGGFSSPLVDSETARGMSLDNQIKATNTYFEKRRLNKMYRAAEAGPRVKLEDHTRRVRAIRPDRLSSYQLDQYAGRINWPLLLKAEYYKANREQFEALYARHVAAGGGINTVEYATLKQLTQSLQTQLSEQVKDSTPEQYTYARKFLTSLQYELRLPAGS